MTSSANPLGKYFRKPGIHTKLPTGGKFFPPGEIELSISNEIAVFPMTAADEITLKNPDMLLNGEALERLFKSCVPGIKEPRKISIPDMDVILLAIKLSSLGEDLPVKTECPKCETKIEVGVPIRPLLDAATTIKEKNEVRIDDEVVVHVKPYDFESKTILDMAAFEERQLYRYLIGQEEMDEVERSRKFGESFDKFARLNLDLVARCVISVSTPEGDVTDHEFIAEFIRNISKESTAKITDAVKELGSSGIDRMITLNCPSETCKHEWKTELVFDPMSFFA